jgi:hypothetical protein
VDDEDGVQWRRWCRQQQRSWRRRLRLGGGEAKIAFNTSGGGGDGREGGSSVGVGGGGDVGSGRRR